LFSGRALDPIQRVEHAHRLRGARVVRAAKKVAKTIVSSPSVRASSHERAFDTTTVVVVVDTNHASAHATIDERTNDASDDRRRARGDVVFPIYESPWILTRSEQHQ
jgi:hypothetical protein